MSELQEDLILYLSSDKGKPSDILNHLSCPLVLTDSLSFEVGLIKLIYPGKFYNVTDGDISYYSFVKKTRTAATIPKQFYSSPDQFIEAFNITIGEDLEYYPLTFDQAKQKFQLLLRTDGTQKAFFQVSENIANLLGFPEQLDQKLGYFESIVPWDQSAEKENMYLHCNIADHVNVGSSYEQLLTIIGHGIGRPTSTGKIEYEPHNVIYLPISSKIISEISISLRTEHGAPFPFIGGKASAVVHLRPRQPTL